MPVLTLMGNDPGHVIEARFDGASVDRVPPGSVRAEFVELVFGPGAVSFDASGRAVNADARCVADLRARRALRREICFGSLVGADPLGRRRRR